MTSKIKKKERKLIIKESKAFEKLDNESTSDLIAELKKFPYGSSQHSKIRSAIAKKICKKYPDQFVLCTHSKFVVDTDDRRGYLSRSADVTEFDILDAISPKKTFFEDDKYKFVPREEAEYNFAWKQISVFGFVTDGANYVILKKKSDSAVTMIGGHVDFSVEAYQCSQLEILRMGMQTEVDEEIVHHGNLVVPEKPTCLVNTYNKFHDLFHMAFVYKIEVDDVDKLFENLRTGEPEKHDIIKVSGKDSLLKLSGLHHWFKEIEKYL